MFQTQHLMKKFLGQHWNKAFLSTVLVLNMCIYYSVVEDSISYLDVEVEAKNCDCLQSMDNRTSYSCFSYRFGLIHNNLKLDFNGVGMNNYIIADDGHPERCGGKSNWGKRSRLAVPDVYDVLYVWVRWLWYPLFLLDSGNSNWEMFIIWVKFFLNWWCLSYESSSS